MLTDGGFIGWVKKFHEGQVVVVAAVRRVKV
jgi:hypothetical protein